MKKVWIGLSLMMLAAGVMAGHGNKGFLGVSLANVETDEPAEQGLRIISVYDDSAAERAGIQAGDLIIEANGAPVNNHGDLTRAMGELKAGDMLALVVLRNGEEHRLEANLGEAPHRARVMMPKKHAVMFDADRAYLGIKYEDLSGQLATFFKVDAGILIKEVVEGTPAEAAGLRAGDVLVAWNDQEVVNSGDLSKVVRAGKRDDVVSLTVVRSGERLELPITLGAVGDYRENMKFEYRLDFDDNEMEHHHRKMLDEKKKN